jgi:hypothetical protein
MSVNINFNFGGGGGFGCGQMGGGGFNPMMGMGGMNPMMGMMGMMGMGGMGGMGGQNPMMQMMQMMMMLMQMMQGMGQMGGGQMPMCPQQGFGCGGPSPCGGGGSPIGDFLGGGGCGGGGGGGNYGNYDNGGSYGCGNTGNAGGVQGNGSGQNTIDIARQFLGQNSRDVAGRMGPFTAAGGNTNNCADFVSSALVASGRLSRRNVNCRGLRRQLEQEGWRQIPASQARAGDVCFPSEGHVQLCQGDGRQIGSNNVRRGFQKITEGRMGRNAVCYTK